MNKNSSKELIVSVDLCLIPIGVGLSLSPYIAICQKEIERSGLNYKLEANGTAIEGEWDKVFSCIKSCHEKVHKAGSVRIYSTLKINTRTDKIDSFEEKVNRVKSALSKAV